MSKLQAWAQDKKKLFILAIVAIQAYLVFGLIAPAYERIPYYQEKIELLKSNNKRLKTNSNHIQFYRERQVAVQNKLANYVQEIDQFREPASLQKWMSHLQKEHQLEISLQKIDVTETHSDFSQISLDQTLSGHYDNHSAYLEKMITSNPFILVTQCTFTNNSPLKSNPLVTMNLKIIFLLPRSG
jgi:Tfp pilus assembly protein PilO